MMAVALLLCVVAVGTSQGFVIQLEANEEACFYEDLRLNGKMGVTFEVGSGGNLDIDFRITGPNGKNLHEGFREQSNTFTFLAQEEGRHTYCFSNKMSIRAKKTVTFTAVAVDDTQAATEAPQPQGGSQNGPFLALSLPFPRFAISQIKND